MKEKEIIRHRRVMEQIKNANKKEELPSITYSTLVNYIINKLGLDKSSFDKGLVEPIVDSLFLGRGIFVDALVKINPGKSEEEYSAIYNKFANDEKIFNLAIEISERNSKLKDFKDRDELDKHNRVMKQISNAYEIKDLPGVFKGDLNRRVQRDFNANDFIGNIKISSIRDVSDALLEEKDKEYIDSLIYNFCESRSLDKDSRELLYLQILSNVLYDERIGYLVSEIKAREARVLKIYELEHEEMMENIKNATRIGQLPPNMTESKLVSYLSGNSIVFEKGEKISSADLKGLTRLLLSGKKWEDKEVSEELVNICSKYYNNDIGYEAVSWIDSMYKMLYNKFSKLPKTYYLVSEINACNAKQKEIISNMSSEVNIYLVPNNKVLSSGGNFYNCYINRGDYLNLKDIFPSGTEDVISPDVDRDGIEWFVQEYYDQTFRCVGGIILNNGETVGKAYVYRPNNESLSISEEEKDDYDKLNSYYERVDELYKKRSLEQKHFLDLQRAFMEAQGIIDSELDELRGNIDTVHGNIKSRKREKKD